MIYKKRIDIGFHKYADTRNFVGCFLSAYIRKRGRILYSVGVYHSGYLKGYQGHGAVGYCGKDFYRALRLFKILKGGGYATR